MDPPSPTERNATENPTQPAVCRVDGCIVCEVGRKPIASDLLSNVSWTSILKLVLAVLHHASKDIHKYFSNHDITNFVCVHWMEISGSKEWTLEYKSRVSDCLSHNPKCFESSERGKWRLYDKTLVNTLIGKFKKLTGHTDSKSSPSSSPMSTTRSSKRTSPKASSTPYSKRQRVKEEQGDEYNCESPSNILENMRSHSQEPPASPALSLSTSFIPSPHYLHHSSPPVQPDHYDMSQSAPAILRYPFQLPISERIVPGSPPSSPTELSPRTPPPYTSPKSPSFFCQPPSPSSTRYYNSSYVPSWPQTFTPSRQYPTLPQSQSQSPYQQHQSHSRSLPSVTELLDFSKLDKESTRRMDHNRVAMDRDMVNMLTKQGSTLWTH